VYIIACINNYYATEMFCILPEDASLEIKAIGDAFLNSSDQHSGWKQLEHTL
jgi:hypothetical protein